MPPDIPSSPHPAPVAARHPVHAASASIATACFVATLVTDSVYAKTATMQWSNMSDWLLIAGLVMLGIAVVTGLVDYSQRVRRRQRPATWLHFAGNAVVFVLALFDELIHTRDAYTSVVPTGLTLSVLVVVLLVVTNWSAGMLTRIGDRS